MGSLTRRVPMPDLNGDGEATIWIVDAHRDDRKRFVVREDEKLTAFFELEAAIHEFAVDAMLQTRRNPLPNEIALVLVRFDDVAPSS